MKSSSRLLLAFLVWIAAATGSALGQSQKFDGSGPYYPNSYPGDGQGGYGGYGYAGDGGVGPLDGAVSMLNVPLLGPLSVSLNGASRGLGFDGSYASVHGTAPLFTDPLCGWWPLPFAPCVGEAAWRGSHQGQVRRSS